MPAACRAAYRRHRPTPHAFRPRERSVRRVSYRPGVGHRDPRHSLTRRRITGRNSHLPAFQEGSGAGSERRDPGSSPLTGKGRGQPDGAASAFTLESPGDLCLTDGGSRGTTIVVRHGEAGKGGGGQRRTPCASRPVRFWLPAFPFPSCSRPPPRAEPSAAAIPATLLDCSRRRWRSIASATAAPHRVPCGTSVASPAS